MSDYNNALCSFVSIILFTIDSRITSSCFELGDWPLSRVYLKNEATYPWFILVPRQPDIHEIYQLTKADRSVLIEEVNQLSLLVQRLFQPAKLNVGSLGNIVSQLHIHVIGRTKDDLLWPQGVWQSALQTTPYSEDYLSRHLAEFQRLIHDNKTLADETT